MNLFLLTVVLILQIALARNKKRVAEAVVTTDLRDNKLCRGIFKNVDHCLQQNTKSYTKLQSVCVKQFEADWQAAKCSALLSSPNCVSIGNFYGKPVMNVLCRH